LAKVGAPGDVVVWRLDAAGVFVPDDVVGGIDGAVAVVVAGNLRQRIELDVRDLHGVAFVLGKAPGFLNQSNSRTATRSRGEGATASLRGQASAYQSISSR
jgi:hypothetical protein